MNIKTFKLGKYKFTFNDSVSHRFIENKYFIGIIFKVDDIEYDVIQNHAMGFRIGLCGLGKNVGLAKDIPFHKGTFHFLPPCVKVDEDE